MVSLKDRPSFSLMNSTTSPPAPQPKQCKTGGSARTVNEGDFSPAFVQAFAARIAMMVSIPLTASQQLFQNAGGLYAGFIKEAKTRDGMQGRSKRIRNRSLLRSR